MAKRRISARKSVAQNAGKQSGEIAASGGGATAIPWPERTKRAGNRARKAGFDVERILFGSTLKEEVQRQAERTIEACEGWNCRQNLLEQICRAFADDIASGFLPDSSFAIDALPDEALSLAISFLYLFPKLWKASDKELTVGQMKALDLKKLLSERRLPL